jgi:hypothetical protein
MSDAPLGPLIGADVRHTSHIDTDIPVSGIGGVVGVSPEMGPSGGEGFHTHVSETAQNSLVLPPHTQSPLEKAQHRRQLIEKGWRAGYLRWKLDSLQRAEYDRIKNSKHSWWYLNWGRRTGKSFLLCVIAVEYALKNPGAQIKYAAGTGKLVRTVIRPILKKLFVDCPKDLQPRFKALEGTYDFANGSSIAVAGCDDGNADSLRGTESHLNIIDEAAFVKDLNYVIDDILRPQTFTTGGRTILSSTPPRSLAHPAITYMQACERVGAYSHKTVYDNVRVSPETREAFIAEDAERLALSVEAYKKSTTFRREYLAEPIADADYAVIPWDAETEFKVVKRVERPAHYDIYTSADFGYVKDCHGILYGYWDFQNARLVIESCDRLVRTPTDVLAKVVTTKERLLWLGPQADEDETPNIYKRVADGGGLGQLIIIDLQRQHKLTFQATQKDAKELQVNQLKMMIANGQLVIDPNCIDLIQQLRTTVWNEGRTSYERNVYGHGDLLDSLVYLVRNIDRSRNPYPSEPGLSRSLYAFHWRKKKQGSEDEYAFLKAFGRKGRD